ncbi:MAG: bifunctional rhamnulose-1-phosphate aldolase/short-chain dehydrogenase, partial [Bacteroidetes bacterium]
MPPSKTFRYVDYLWDENRAREFEGDEVALLLYRSNLLGADLRITNYGGGNTSCKTLETHPLTGEPVEVMWIKGSGGDLGTLTRQGLAGLYTHRLRALEGRYRGPEHEDEMVALLRHCLFDPDSRTPSIDTPLHGLLPFKHIDHLHPDAVIAIAAAKDSRELTRRIWGESMGWVPWRRPGFELALQLRRCVEENPGIRGIVLAGHGLFTWGESSHACYQNSLEVIEAAGAFLAAREGRSRPVFGGAKLEPLPPAERRRYAASLMPTLRGLCSSEQRMVGHFTDDERLLQFVNSHDLERLAPLGTSCPDHFLRTKIQPLVLSLPSD